MEPTPVMRQQRAHRSVRQYTGEPIKPALLDEILRSGQAAASSSFIQAYSVIRVTAPESRRIIAAAAGGQAWIERAAEFLVFCADLRRLDAACRHARLGALEGYTEHALAAVVDVALFAQNVLLAAESAGLGGVMIGGIRNDPGVVVERLALPDLVVPVFGMCLGWPAAAPEIKPRLPLELVLHQDRYRDPAEAELAAYDLTMADYYRTRTDNNKLTDWRNTVAKALQGKKREHMLGFLRDHGFCRR